MDTHTRDTKYKWVRNGSDYLYEVGLLADGSLHNPRGYPEDVVRVAVLAANEDCRQRRSRSAKKAAETRARRREKKIYEVSQKLLLGHKYGPTTHCIICGKTLGDPQSIERGIGSDCWQEILRSLEKIEMMMKTPNITNSADGYFGLCPICKRTDGYLNIDRDHYFVCHEHKLRWLVGSNLFSTWRAEDPDVWQENNDLLSGYRELEPNL